MNGTPGTRLYYGDWARLVLERLWAFELLVIYAATRLSDHCFASFIQSIVIFKRHQPKISPLLPLLHFPQKYKYRQIRHLSHSSCFFGFCSLSTVTISIFRSKFCYSSNVSTLSSSAVGNYSILYFLPCPAPCCVSQLAQLVAWYCVQLEAQQVSSARQFPAKVDELHPHLKWCRSLPDVLYAFLKSPSAELSLF